MSFSGMIKEELSEHYAKARHCNLAELSAFVRMSGEFAEDKKGRCIIRFHTENFTVARKCFTLLQKTFNIDTCIAIRRNMSKGSCGYNIYAKGEELLAVKNALVQAVCCKRAYIRGAFITAGSMSDPGKSYHFEIVCASQKKAEQLQELLLQYEIDAKTVLRKQHYVVYVKEGAQIVKLLGLMGAHVSLMQLENIRIVKEMRNSVNRKVNCETANLNKTVSASVRQVEDIRYIEQHKGLHELTEGLEEIARLRLEHPDASLKELGDMLSPQVGKSGVNHRLRKLSLIAEQLRKGEEE